MAQAPIKVNEETKERIRYLAALVDTTQADVVDRGRFRSTPSAMPISSRRASIGPDRSSLPATQPSPPICSDSRSTTSSVSRAEPHRTASGAPA